MHFLHPLVYHFFLKKKNLLVRRSTNVRFDLELYPVAEPRAHRQSHSP